MHELVRESVAAVGKPHVLARWPCDDGALLALFSDSPTPCWLARTAIGPRACARLRAEARALRHLEPWAEVLAIPRLLAWSDETTGDGGAQCCLIQSGLPGSPLPRRRTVLDIERGPLPDWLQMALAWLEGAQQRVTVAAWLRAPSSGAGYGGREAAAAATMDAELQAWCEELRRFAASDVGPRAVASHGDFWSGNLLFQPHRPGWVGVVDWCGLDARSPLHDVCTLLTRVPWRSGHAGPASGGALGALLHPGPARDCLRAWASRCGLDEATARTHFYAYLLERMRWEFGYDLQTRTAAECSQARVEWRPAIAALRARHWPDPFLTP